MRWLLDIILVAAQSCAELLEEIQIETEMISIATNRLFVGIAAKGRVMCGLNTNSIYLQLRFSRQFL